MKKKRRNRFYSLWSGAIILALVLVVFSLIFASAAGGGSADDGSASDVPVTDRLSEDTPTSDFPNPQGTPQTDAPASPDEPAGDAPTILGETEDMGQEYIDRIIFLGDSTTHGLAVYNVVDPNHVWTPASGTLTLDHWSYTAIVYPDTGEEILIPAAVELKKPEYMVITLGINGVSFMDEDYFVETYTALVQAIQAASPDTKIILNSIYPIAASYANQGSINNQKIDTANTWVQRVAEDTGVRYLNSCIVLKGDDGFMPESYQNGDGLHPTGEAYGYVIDYIRTHGYK